MENLKNTSDNAVIQLRDIFEKKLERRAPMIISRVREQLIEMNSVIHSTWIIWLDGDNNPSIKYKWVEGHSNFEHVSVTLRNVEGMRVDAIYQFEDSIRQTGVFFIPENDLVALRFPVGVTALKRAGVYRTAAGLPKYTAHSNYTLTKEELDSRKTEISAVWTNMLRSTWMSVASVYNSLPLSYEMIREKESFLNWYNIHAPFEDGLQVEIDEDGGILTFALITGCKITILDEDNDLPGLLVIHPAKNESGQSLVRAVIAWLSHIRVVSTITNARGDQFTTETFLEMCPLEEE